jgi:hypothetical protein
MLRLGKHLSYPVRYRTSHDTRERLSVTDHLPSSCPNRSGDDLKERVVMTIDYPIGRTTVSLRVVFMSEDDIELVQDIVCLGKLKETQPQLLTRILKALNKAKIDLRLEIPKDEEE